MFEILLSYALEDSNVRYSVDNRGRS